MTVLDPRSPAVVLALAVVLSACAVSDGGQDALDGDEASVARGEAIYAANCMRCHGGAEGGDIADIPPPHNAEGHTWHHADCDLLDIIAEGLPDRPGLPRDAPTMPPFADELDADDRRAVLDFIRTWWTPEQQATQQRVTEQVCDPTGG